MPRLCELVRINGELASMLINCVVEATQNAIKIARIKMGRSSQKAFERDLGTVIYDEMTVYEAIQMQSLKYCWPTVNIEDMH